jgi:hypothetical protein
VLAVSSEETRSLEAFQLQRKQGPCLDCYRSCTRASSSITPCPELPADPTPAEVDRQPLLASGQTLLDGASRVVRRSQRAVAGRSNHMEFLRLPRMGGRPRRLRA